MAAKNHDGASFQHVGEQLYCSSMPKSNNSITVVTSARRLTAADE